MDVRNWPLNQIMQLPDCCFGRRFVVSCAVSVSAPGIFWDISEIAFPDQVVLWELNILSMIVVDIPVKYRIAIGDQLPTSAAMMTALEPLIPGLGITGAEPRFNDLVPRLGIKRMGMRQVLASQGRRLVIELASAGPIIQILQVGVTISSLPTEVPDWLNSGHHRSP